MDKVPMTDNSYNLLEEELKTLKSEDRPNVCLLYTSDAADE